MTLYNKLFDLLIRQDYSIYRGFFLLRTSPLVYSKVNQIQRKLESYRPEVDYVVLPTGDLLIGYSSDFDDLKLAAYELIMQHRVDLRKSVLSFDTASLGFLQLYKDLPPTTEIIPELLL